MIDFLILHLDYIAMFFLLLGYFRMSFFKPDGWAWTCLGSILLVIFGTSVIPGAKGVAIGNAVFAVIAIVGFIKWRKSNKI